uniref:Uncharacterized protein n=1 Tax=Knipowitschia caucasica TaxID=637954 RepID=A0AAV2JGB6_KNICA
MSLLTPDEDRKWLPTHVQVTVLKGRGLRGKGKHGTSDVYTIIQLGKEKYSTCVVEKTTEPEWREECTFEVQPDALERGSELVLTVMHRALIGLDVFLGQAVIPLDEVFTASRGVKNQWYRLNSKTGKKEKERGEIQVTVQFTRNNLTASMYDLVMKDKGVSTFFKLKERIKGKRRSSEEDSSSAILPGGYGSLVRMRQRLPSDGGGEEYYEDDEGGEVRRSKMRTFFLRGKLRKSSDTRSSTSLGSESSESSSRGGSLSPTAGISVVVSDLSNSPSNSSNLTADNSPEHTANTSPKLTSPKCEFEDEAGEITIAVPQPEVCVNGSHSLSVQPLDSGKAALLGLGLLKPLPLSMSLQNLSPQDKDLPPCILAEGRRWSFDKPDAEEKAAIAAALEQSGPMQADPEEDGLDPASSCTVEANGHIQRRKEDSELASTEDRHKGWFGSKDLHNKPSHSPVMSLTDSHSPTHSWGSSVDSPGHLTNPFSPSPPLLSRSNPFFTTLHNPFFKDMSCTQPLNPSPPPLPFLSSARPPITTLFPEVNMQFSNLSRKTLVEKEEQTELNKMPKPSPSEQGMDSELDHSFDEFAAGRLQSPDDITPDSKTLQNTSCSDPPLDCLGSSAEDDGLSCFSSCSASDKLSSSEETEVHNFESSFEKNPGIKNVKTSESEEEFTDKSEDMSLDQQTVFELEAEHGTLQRSLSEGELKPALDELHPPAFGSDPELASSKPQPALLLFSPLTPSLTPQCSSSPIALCPPPPVADTATWESPAQQQQQTANQLVSPHPVKPLTTAAEDKKNEGRSMLEKLKFTRNTGKSSPSTDDSDKKKALTEGAGSYYHLTHSELVALLVQREAEHHTQKAEFERQKILLAKRETELKRLKPQVRDLEDYIDTLLVRIMEQKPTLLQVGSKNK